MTTLIQSNYAEKLVSLLNDNGFSAKLNDEHQECVDTVTYSKDGIFGKELLVHELTITKTSLNDDLAQCEKEIKHAIENGAIDTRNMNEEEYLNAIYA